MASKNKKPPTPERIIKTWSGRILLPADAAEKAALDAYGRLFGRGTGLCLKLASEGKNLKKEKKLLQGRLGVSAWQANSLRQRTEGMVNSAVSNLPGRLREAEQRLKTAKAKTDRIKADIAAAGAKPPAAFLRGRPGKNAEAKRLKTVLHGKGRRLAILAERVATLESNAARAKKGDLSGLGFCLGGNKLFRAQFNLRANGYPCHAAWRAEWDETRSSQFFVVGSSDEDCGNREVRVFPSALGFGFDLRIRLPHALEREHGKFVALKNAEFPRGAAALMEALSLGLSISWRFVRDGKGWTAFFTCETAAAEPAGSLAAGCLGVDVNAGHLACSLSDRKGNLVRAWDIGLDLSGLSTAQAADRIGKAAAEIRREALAAGVAVAVEILDFSKKKAKAEETGKRYNRMLSALAHRKIIDAIGRACRDAGITVVPVNPAFTSVMSKNHFAPAREISVHQGAAWAIARRALGCKEKKEWLGKKPRKVLKSGKGVRTAKAAAGDSACQPGRDSSVGKQQARVDRRSAADPPAHAGEDPETAPARGAAVQGKTCSGTRPPVSDPFRPGGPGHYGSPRRKAEKTSQT